MRSRIISRHPSPGGEGCRLIILLLVFFKFIQILVSKSFTWPDVNKKSMLQGAILFPLPLVPFTPKEFSFMVRGWHPSPPRLFYVMDFFCRSIEDLLLKMFGWNCMKVKRQPSSIPLSRLADIQQDHLHLRGGIRQQPMQGAPSHPLEQLLLRRLALRFWLHLENIATGIQGQGKAFGDAILLRSEFHFCRVCVIAKQVNTPHKISTKSEASTHFLPGKTSSKDYLWDLNQVLTPPFQATFLKESSERISVLTKSDWSPNQNNANVKLHVKCVKN